MIFVSTNSHGYSHGVDRMMRSKQPIKLWGYRLHPSFFPLCSPHICPTLYLNPNSFLFFNNPIKLWVYIPLSFPFVHLIICPKLYLNPNSFPFFNTLGDLEGAKQIECSAFAALKAFPHQHPWSIGLLIDEDSELKQFNILNSYRLLWELGGLSYQPFVALTSGLAAKTPKPSVKHHIRLNLPLPNFCLPGKLPSLSMNKSVDLKKSFFYVFFIFVTFFCVFHVFCRFLFCFFFFIFLTNTCIPARQSIVTAVCVSACNCKPRNYFW